MPLMKSGSTDAYYIKNRRKAEKGKGSQISKKKKGAFHSVMLAQVIVVQLHTSTRGKKGFIKFTETKLKIKYVTPLQILFV